MKNSLSTKHSLQISILLSDKKVWYITINALLILTPILIGHEQLIVGTLTNLFLIILGKNYSGKHFFPSAALPSIAVIIRNSLLGSFTPAVALMLPGIWLGNLLFVTLINQQTKKEINEKYLIVPVISKFILISIFSLAFIGIFDLPVALIPAFTWMQLVTAFTAMVIYSSSKGVLKNLTKNNQG